jgi:hypothetical protein
MTDVTLAIVYTDVPGFPAGSVVDHIVATVTGTANTTPVTQNAPPGTASIVFPSLPADTYTFSVGGTDAAGTVFGTAVTGSFTITEPTTVTLSLPSTVDVTQSLSLPGSAAPK